MSGLIAIASPVSGMGGHAVPFLAIAFLIAVFILLLRTPRQRVADRARQVEGGVSGGTSVFEELNTSNEPGPPQIDAPSDSTAGGPPADAGAPQVDAPSDSTTGGSPADAGAPLSLPKTASA